MPAVPLRVAAGSAPGLTGTRAMVLPDGGPPTTDLGAAAPAPAGPAPHVRARRRSRRVFAVWMALVVVLALLVGVTAWWLGSGRWTAMPSLVGIGRTPPSTCSRGRPRRQRGDRAATTRSRREASPPPTRPRVPRCCGAAPSRSPCRTGRPDGAGDRRGHRGRRRRAGGPRRRAHPGAVHGRGRVQRLGAGGRGRAHRPGGRHRAGRRAARHARAQPGRRGRPPGPGAGAVPDRPPLDDAAEILSDAGLEAEERSSFPFGRRNGRVVDQTRAPARWSTAARRSP